MSTLPRIKKLHVVRAHRLAITWKDGGTDTVDLSGVIIDFEPFHLAAFADVAVVGHGSAVEWGNGLDMGADNLAVIAEEQRQFTGEDFRRWMEKIGLSLAEVADMLEISRSTVKNYRRREQKPLPTVVAIACRAVDADEVRRRAHLQRRRTGCPRNAAAA